MLLDSCMEQLRLGGNHTKLLVPTVLPPSLGRNFEEILRHVILMKG
jgi:hypothetical protein